MKISVRTHILALEACRLPGWEAVRGKKDETGGQRKRKADLRKLESHFKLNNNYTLLYY
jgi:hypothetical protein